MISQQFFNTIQYVLKCDAFMTKLSSLTMIALFGCIIGFVTYSGERFNRKVKQIFLEADERGNSFVRNLSIAICFNKLDFFVDAIDSSQSHKPADWIQNFWLNSIKLSISVWNLSCCYLIHYRSYSIWFEYVNTFVESSGYQ